MPRILVAEDDEFLRFFMARALTEQGFDVDAVADGRRALRLLRGQDHMKTRANPATGREDSSEETTGDEVSRINLAGDHLRSAVSMPARLYGDAANDDEPGSNAASGGRPGAGCAAGADQATEPQEEPGFDLLVSDIAMPLLDGLSLARAVGVEFPDLPVLLVTGHAGQYEAAVPLRRPVRAVLTKPFTLHEICETVSSCLSDSLEQAGMMQN